MPRETSSPLPDTLGSRLGLPSYPLASDPDAAASEPPRIEGVLVSCSERLFNSVPAASSLFHAADAAFVHVLGLYLVLLYFSIMCETVYKNTNEFKGNEDFYVVANKL